MSGKKGIVDVVSASPASFSALLSKEVLLMRKRDGLFILVTEAALFEQSKSFSSSPTVCSEVIFDSTLLLKFPIWEKV